MVPHGRRSDDHDENLTVPIPGVANAEEDAGVVAGIVIAEAGVGVVNDVKPEIDGALRPNKPMDAATDLRGEINAGSVGRWNVGGGKKDAACNVDVGNELARLREVPLRDEGLDAGSIDGTVGSEDGIDGHEFDGVLEIAADGRTGKKIRSEDEAAASAGEEELSIGRLASSSASAEEGAELPNAAAIGKGISRSGRIAGQTRLRLSSLSKSGQ